MPFSRILGRWLLVLSLLFTALWHDGHSHDDKSDSPQASCLSCRLHCPSEAGTSAPSIPKPEILARVAVLIPSSILIEARLDLSFAARGPPSIS